MELDLAGVRLSVTSDSPELREWLSFDFAAFPPTGSAPDIHLTARVGPPTIPAGLRERFRGPCGVCFDEGSLRHVLYPGPVWVHYDYGRESGVVEGEEPALVYQRLYLTALSRVGECLDRRGLHRVHGMALAGAASAALFLLPSGGGKSTLALELLRLPGLRLLSEDTPLLDRRGRLHPFPFRLGLREPQPQAAERHGKWLLRADGFPLAERPLPCSQLFVGSWTTGAPAVSRALGLGALLRDCVLGWGVPQVSELFLRLTPADTLAKAGIAASRLAAVSVLAARAGCARLWLGPDPQENAAFVQSLLRP